MPRVSGSPNTLPTLGIEKLGRRDSCWAVVIGLGLAPLGIETGFLPCTIRDCQLKVLCLSLGHYCKTLILVNVKLILNASLRACSQEHGWSPPVLDLRLG